MQQQPLNFDAAEARGTLGAERAAAKAERKLPGWVDRTAEEVRDYARVTDCKFTIEQARSMCAPMPSGADARAWGHVTRRAVVLGYIERVPGEFAAAASSNGSPKPLYRRGRNA